jgi:hypothetical protein
MTEFSSPEIENSNVDLASQGMRLHVMEQTTRARAALARSVGTHDHSVLVAAVKRNFPEIYDHTSKGAGATGQTF